MQPMSGMPASACWVLCEASNWMMSEVQKGSEFTQKSLSVMALLRAISMVIEAKYLGVTLAFHWDSKSKMSFFSINLKLMEVSL